MELFHPLSVQMQMFQKNISFNNLLSIPGSFLVLRRGTEELSTEQRTELETENIKSKILYYNIPSATFFSLLRIHV